MSFDDHPAASADDAHDREFIMKISMQRAVEQHGTPFVSPVYVGDGIWDARSCRTLGIPSSALVRVSGQPDLYQRGQFPCSRTIPA